MPDFSLKCTEFNLGKGKGMEGEGKGD